MGMISKLITAGLALGAVYTAYQAAQKTKSETGSPIGGTFGRNFMKQAGENVKNLKDAVKVEISLNDESDEQAQEEAAAEKTSDENSFDTAPDYSKNECWFQIPEISKDVDTFYIYSTVCMSANDGDPDYATLDNKEMLDGVKLEHVIKSSVFEDSTNVFIPYYRQATMPRMGNVWQKDKNVEAAISESPYHDLTAALDYYFEHYNEGRPFIFAGHSQGSALVRMLLKTYFKDHPDYYARMIAAYAIGYSITKEDLAENAHMKFATGESDTGVIISWHTEGPKNMEAHIINPAMLPNGVAINPLNWKLDETYAPASENLGSLVMDEKTGETEIRDIGADAKLDTTRGTVVTHAAAVANDMVDLAGPESFHQDDYSIFYNNIKDNVAKRIAAYKAKQ